MSNIFEEWLQDFFEELTPKEFYREVFPEGELDEKDKFNKGRYTGIAVEVTKEKKKDGTPKILRHAITDDLETIERLCESKNFCLCSPISYCGKQRTAENARFVYAIAVDLDKIRIVDGKPVGLMNMWSGHITKLERLPKPSYIVSSGTGLHLYYVFEKPIALYQKTVKELQKYKRELTRLIWHDSIADIKSEKDVQQEGIFQGFRMPGTITKNGSRARVFETGRKVTIEYLNSFVRADYKINNFTEKKELTRARAKELYPGWYERRVVNNEPKGVWHVSRNLYDWWRGEILAGATVGHRYYCMMNLAIYARKCSMYDAKHNPAPVTREELEKDCFEIMEYFETLTDSEDNHFDESDVLAALEAFDDKWITYPRTAVSYKSGIDIKQNKRNGRKQKDHIKIMNFIRDEVSNKTDWNKSGNGRKSKAENVQEWQAAHPDGKKADCIRETGLDKKTVYKHWKA